MKMKKMISAVLAGIMVIGISSLAIAAPSITAVLDTNNVKASEGEIVITKEVEVVNLPEEGKKGVEALVEAEKGITLAEAFKKVKLDLSKIPVITDLLNAEGNEELRELKAEDLKILTPVVELKFEGVIPTKENPVDVTFTVNNATDDVDIYALHYCEEHGWELLCSDKVEDEENQIKVPFHSASPVALVYAEKETDTNSTDKSPATK